MNSTQNKAVKLLLVEDEAKIAEFMREGLADEGYEPEVVASAEEAIQAVGKKSYDAFVVDIMLPGVDGLRLTSLFREMGITEPILILSARGAMADKVSGLDSGADDYLTKPFAFEELAARIRALTRKASGYRRAEIKIDDLTLDPNSKSVSRAGENVPLSKKEYQLLEYLSRNRDRLVTRAMISASIWEAEGNTYTNIIDVFITHLRRKIDLPNHLKLIHTIRGKGFMISAEQPGTGDKEGNDT